MAVVKLDPNVCVRSRNIRKLWRIILKKNNDASPSICTPGKVLALIDYIDETEALLLEVLAEQGLTP